MTQPRLTILDLTVAYEREGELEHTQLAACFDHIKTQEAARLAGRQIGDAVGEALCLKLQHGANLAR